MVQGLSYMMIAVAISAYLQSLRNSRSPATALTYEKALRQFSRFLEAQNFNPAEQPVDCLSQAQLRAYIESLLEANTAPSTQRLYTAAVKGFLKYLKQQELAPALDVQLLSDFAANRLPKTRQGLPQFPRDELEAVIQYAESLGSAAGSMEQQALIDLRDRAFILTLADTGLRVQEACQLRRKQIDWHEGRALITGKGGKEAVVRFSRRALRALRAYLDVREPVLDLLSGKQLSALPLFTGHGLRNTTQAAGAGKARHQLKPMTTETGREIIRQRTREALGREVREITPHAFRHYFVTSVLLGTGNLKLAQNLARHSDISSTQRYAHLADGELDQAYEELFNQNE